MTDQLQQRLEERIRLLEERLARVESAELVAPTCASLVDDDGAAVASPAVDDRSSRRALLRRAGAAAAGAVALHALSQDRAAAADGGNVVIGAANTGTSPTRLSVGTDIFSDTSPYALSVQANSTPVNTALFAAGSNIGVSASGNRLGLLLNSSVSHVRLVPNVPATTTSANLLRGELRADTAGNLWYQHTDGVGNAVKISGPADAGAFHVIDPFRVYDSRTPGILGAGATRAVPVTTAANSPVPAGAKAIVATLTLTGTQGSFGFLTITAGDVASTTASSINWFGADQSLATTVVSKLDAAGGVKLFNNSPNATNFILDITGYYR